MLMSTLVDLAGELAERPDLTIDNPIVRGLLSGAIYQLHKMQNFERDVEEIVTPITDLTQYKYSITLPTRFRNLVDICIVDIDDVPLVYDFERSYARRVPTDYVGLRKVNYYTLVGTAAEITLSPPTNAANLILSYLALPVIQLNPLSQEWEVESWIADTYDYLVAAKLAQYFGGLTSEEDTTKSISQIVTEQEFSLINDNPIITLKH